jgi:hypothetical protein
MKVADRRSLAREVEALFAPPVGASLAGAGVRWAGRGAAMPVSKPATERTAGDLPPRDGREADDHAEQVFLAYCSLPAPAGRFGITDPQQWIDLCG